MKKRTLLLAGLLALAMCLVALSGCMPPTGPLSSSDTDGSVVVSFSDGRARTIAPAVSLDIFSYDISFTRAGQSTVTLTGISGSTSQTQPVYLKPGPWSVTAIAKNGAGDIIGVASTDVTVNAGKTTTAALTMLSLSGNGTLTLTATISDMVMSAPSVVGTLTPGGAGDPITLSFTMGGGSANYTGSVAGGSYLLELELWDGTVKLASYVDTVLVVADFPTTGSLSFKPKNGSVVVQLFDQLTRAIPISLSGALATLSAGSTMTVRATPAVAVDSYQWYLDGVGISGGTGEQVTVGSGLEAGDYELVVVVKKGAVYSSESVGFTVTAAASGAGFRSVSAGDFHTMILKNDGTLRVCGWNDFGQLGNGTTTDRSVPVEVMAGVASVSGGDAHTIILKRDGTLWVCGWNVSGQLGDGATANRSTPFQIMAGVASVSAGGIHTMILKSDGTLWACGDNRYGQLGDGTTTSRSAPVLVMASVASASAGSYHTMILKSDGTLWACGYNAVGQLGVGDTTNRSTPIQIMAGVASVSAGDFHNVILKSDGSLWACGWNNFGQLGVGDFTSRSTPVPVMTGVVSVSGGYAQTMIVKSDGTLWACGYNDYGQLGDGTTTDRLTAVLIMAGVASVSAGFYHTITLKSDGTVWTFGSNAYGQLGDGTTTDRHTPVQICSDA